MPIELVHILAAKGSFTSMSDFALSLKVNKKYILENVLDYCIIVP